jgi:hypothetical protein
MRIVSRLDPFLKRILGEYIKRAELLPPSQYWNVLIYGFPTHYVNYVLN